MILFDPKRYPMETERIIISPNKDYYFSYIIFKGDDLKQHLLFLKTLALKNLYKQ